MTGSIQRQALTLGVVVAAGLLGLEVIRRIRRTGGFAEVNGKYQAITDPAGKYLRCEEYRVVGDKHETVGVVADSNCGGCGGFGFVEGCPP